MPQPRSCPSTHTIPVVGSVPEAEHMPLTQQPPAGQGTLAQHCTPPAQLGSVRSLPARSPPPPAESTPARSPPGAARSSETLYAAKLVMAVQPARNIKGKANL